MAENITIKRVLKQATDIGACSLTQGVETIQDACALFFSPQGREFCIKNLYPQMKDCLMMKAKHCANYGVFVNYGRVQVSGGGECAFIGKTHGVAHFEGNEKKHVVVLMHGASVELHLSKCAVVRVEKTPECAVSIIYEDKEGGIVLW